MLRNSKYFLIPLGLSIFGFIIYLITAAPSMSWEDSMNFVDASVNLGVNLPPAPLYVFIAHFFTLLPFGTVIFRLQLFSAILAAISLFLLYRITIWIADQVTNNEIEAHHNKNFIKESEKSNDRNIILSGIFGVLTLAFSYEFWSQAQNTEKFVLEVFIELLVLFLVTISLSSRKKIFPIFLSVCFLLGISMGTDPVVISFFPSILFILWGKKRELNIQKLLLLIVTGIVGALLVFSYIPIMATHNSFLNFARPLTFSRILFLILGQNQNNNINGFTGSANVYFSSVWHFFVMIWVDFTPLILPFMILGGWHLWEKQKRIFWLLFLIILTNFILSTLYLSGNQELWYLLPDVSLAIFAGIGFFWLTQKLKGSWYIILLFIISLAPLFYWWTGLERNGWKINDDFMYNLYNPIKEPAILLGGSDLFVDNSYYIHDVSNYKTDVIPVLDNFYTNYVYTDNLQKTANILLPDVTKYYPINADNYSAFVNDFFALNLPKYNIYIDYPVFNSTVSGIPTRQDGTPSFRLDTSRFKLIPAGLAYEVMPVNSNIQPNSQDFDFQFSNSFPEKKPTIEERVYNDQLNNLVKQYVFAYIAIGDYLFQEGETNQAIGFYNKGYEMDPNNGAILSKLGIYYVEHNQPQEAIKFFKQGSQSYPNDPNWLFNIAVTDGELGNTNEAVSILQQIIARTPSDSPLNQKANAVLNKIETAVNK